MENRERGAVVRIQHVEQWAWLVRAEAGGVAAADDAAPAALNSRWEIRYAAARARGRPPRAFQLFDAETDACLAVAGRDCWAVQTVNDGTCSFRAVSPGTGGDPPAYLNCSPDGVTVGAAPEAWLVTVVGLPIVDVQPLFRAEGCDEETRADVGRKIVDCGDIGFFGIVGHGLGEASTSVAAAAHAAMDRGHVGSPPLKTTLASSSGEVKTKHPGQPPGWEHAVPPAWLPVEPGVVPRMFSLGEQVGRRILDVIVETLALDLSVCGEVYTVLKMMVYAPSPTSESIGLVSHTDKDFLTVLVQDGTPGLQVEGRDSETWMDVPGSHAVVVNIGDALQALSQGRLKSKVHRAVRPSVEQGYRVSFPFFVEPTAWPDVPPEHANAMYIVHEL
ncbi:1-aminocyclopropane-1-carboxylate oxidase [Diplonema papillatum]|nr:1-aminocyclopropane-1-carboxylate oxidase [Diplonema papillatum]